MDMLPRESGSKDNAKPARRPNIRTVSRLRVKRSSGYALGRRRLHPRGSDVPASPRPPWRALGRLVAQTTRWVIGRLWRLERMGGTARAASSADSPQNSQPMEPNVLDALVLSGLVIGVMLYAALVRRRASVRAETRALAAQLTASSEIALGRIGEAARRHAAQMSASKSTTEERRTGGDWRSPEVRARGRGRRRGGDRRSRQSRPSTDPAS